MKRYIAFLLMAAMSLLLGGCSMLLDQDYRSVEPHANRYWEDSGNDILRAESYQDLVNTLMLLVEQHTESGVLRLYLSDVDYATALDLMKRAIAEVQEETAIGSYTLESMDFDMEELRNSYYQVTLQPTYRRSAEDVAQILETASSSAIYEMLVAAWKNGDERLTVRYAYLAEEQSVLLENIRQLQIELEEIPVAQSEEPVLPAAEEGENPQPETEAEAPEEPADPSIQFPEGYEPWPVYFYPPEGESSIIEIFLHSGEGSAA